MMIARVTYVQNMRVQLDQLNEQLGSLEAKASSVRWGRRHEYEIELARLGGHARAIQAKWEELDAVSEASWRQWSSDMDHARDAFIRALNDFRPRH